MTQVIRIIHIINIMSFNYNLSGNLNAFRLTSNSSNVALAIGLRTRKYCGLSIKNWRGDVILPYIKNFRVR